MVKIIIAGSRNFNKYSIVEQEVIEYLMNRNIKKKKLKLSAAALEVLID